MSKLTPKQQLFVKEYLKDLNATQACIRAGYSAKNADKIGSELLGKTRVADAIQKEMDKRAKRIDISADKLLQEMAYVAFSDATEFVNIETVPKINEYDEVEYNANGEPITEQIVTLKDTKELSPIQRKAIHSIKQGANGIELKLHDKLKAQELLGKHLKLFTDKIEQENTGEITIKLEGDLEKWSK